MEMSKVEELLRSLMQGLPPGLVTGASGLREDLENNFRAVLRANLLQLGNSKCSVATMFCFFVQATPPGQSWRKQS